ncbi:MAG: family 78 glycoside hydrolase catalytic domain, partial [Bacteroidaceae bacterium]|nr:family 78 glycoside hydrolase catalytic domain [Bacteroidaceae bacterium]
MKKQFYLSVALFVFQLSAAFALDVVGLRTEDYRNPVGIDKSAIHLSWQLESEQRGVMQTSYNVEIATDAAFGNVVWTSGTVESDKSVDVETNGFTPSAETRYYWRVTVTDNKGGSAISSEKAYFETGLMNSDAWSSTYWIKPTTNDQGSEAEEAVTDYEVEVKFNIKQLAAGLIFAASDHSNYYMWQVNTNGSTRFRPHRWGGGNPSLLSESAITGVTIRNGEQHTLKVVITNASVAKTYIDNVLIDTRTGDFAYGEFGFREDYDNGNQPEQAYFDDFIVKTGDKVLLEEHFDRSECMFTQGTLQDGQYYISGPATYAWQQTIAKPVHFDVEYDFTLVQDNASICFSATSGDTYMMWAINTFEVTQPVVRRHVYKNGNLTYNDTPITAFSKNDLIGHQHHIVLECETPYVRTYIDDVLVDTYQDTQGVLAIGDLGVRVSATGNEREKAYFDNIQMTVYDESGNGTVTFSEDFEGAGNAFNATDIREFGGSRQCYMEAAVGSSKRLMQQDGSVTAGVPIFRKTFELGSNVRRARLYATGLGVYNVFINGERVGQTDDDGNTWMDELKPGATEMFKTVFYTTHDVTALLQAGKNAIGAEVSSGWWNGGIVHGTYGNKSNAFRALLKVELEDGSTITIPTDLTWLSNTNGPLRKGDIYNGETYDARLEDSQFTPDYDDSDWFAVAVSNDFKGEILAFEGPAIQAVEALRRYPQTIQIYEGTVSNGKTYGAINVVDEVTGQNNFNLSAGQTAVIDLGQNGSGWVSFTAKGAPGTKLRFRFGEMPNTTGDRGRGDDGPAGSVYTENLRSAEATLYYTLRGDTMGESFHPTSTYFGFRYIEVTSSSDVELTNVIGETVTSAVEEKSSFRTSHDDVNKLYSNVMWGQRSNFVSVPTDCPQRDERMGWTADTQVYSMAGLYNGDTRNFYKKWMRDMRDAQRSDGAYGVIAPYHWQV